MTSFSDTFALILLVTAVLLTAGCTGQTVDGNGGGNISAQPVENGYSGAIVTSAETLNTNSKEALSPIDRINQYEASLSPAQQKIPSSLQQIIYPDYPAVVDPKTGMTPARIRDSMISNHQMIPADQAITKFNISNTTRQPVGDQVHMYIYVNASLSTDIIDSVVTSVAGRDEKNHIVVAWVDMNNLEKLAGINGVKSMSIVNPPELS